MNKIKLSTLLFTATMMFAQNVLAVVSGNCGARSGTGTTDDPYVYADTCQWTLDTDTGEMNISGSGNMYSAAYDSTTGYPSPWKSYRSSIKNVTIEYGITNVADGAFHSATRLETINVADSVTKIGESAFRGTALTSVKIPASVTSIVSNALGNNSYLKNITFEGNMPKCGVGWIKNASSDLIINFSGSDADKEKLLQAVAQGGVYQYICDNDQCHTIPSPQENVTIRFLAPDGAMIYYNDKGKIIKMNGKRIYTIDEANRVTGQKNRISIKYR